MKYQWYPLLIEDTVCYGLWHIEIDCKNNDVAFRKSDADSLMGYLANPWDVDWIVNQYQGYIEEYKQQYEMRYCVWNNNCWIQPMIS